MTASLQLSPSPLVRGLVRQADQVAALAGLKRSDVSRALFDDAEQLDRLDSTFSRFSVAELDDLHESLNVFASENGVSVPEPTLEVKSLSALVRSASQRLDEATSAAEVLEARAEAAFGYDAAKAVARLARAKGAHDELVGAAYRTQALLLEIDAAAKRRLADEYDAAQERGEVQRHGGDRTSKVLDGNVAQAQAATISDLGLTRKEIHEARQLRDAEIADPGIVHRTVYERLEAGHEPTRASIRAVLTEVLATGKPVAPPAAPAPVRDQVPDAQFDAAVSVNGKCRQITEALEGFGASYIIGGFVDEPMRQRSIAAYRACRDSLSQLLEACRER